MKQICQCEYDNCEQEANRLWSKKHYCQFHYQVLRKARSNRLRKLSQERLQAQGVYK